MRVCLFLSLFCYFCREFFNVVVWLVGRKYGVRSLLYMRLWGWKVIIGVKDIGKYGMGGYWWKFMGFVFEFLYFGVLCFGDWNVFLRVCKFILIFLFFIGDFWLFLVFVEFRNGWNSFCCCCVIIFCVYMYWMWVFSGFGYLNVFL